MRSNDPLMGLRILYYSKYVLEYLGTRVRSQYCASCAEALRPAASKSSANRISRRFSRDGDRQRLLPASSELSAALLPALFMALTLGSVVGVPGETVRGESAVAVRCLPSLCDLTELPRCCCADWR